MRELVRNRWAQVGLMLALMGSALIGTGLLGVIGPVAVVVGACCTAVACEAWLSLTNEEAETGAVAIDDGTATNETVAVS
jgi:hypothetical protein